MNKIALPKFNVAEISKRIIKYLVEGLAIAIAAFFIPEFSMSIGEVFMIALTGASVFAILDLYAPSIAVAARQGAGIGIGMKTVGYRGNSIPM